MTESKAPEGGRPVSEMQRRVARAIWNIRREYEDRCDMELEDMGAGHEVWAEALAAMKAMREPTLDALDAGERAYRAARTQGVCGMTIEAQTRAECARFSAGWKAAFDTEISLAEGGKDNG